MEEVQFPEQHQDVITSEYENGCWAAHMSTIFLSARLLFLRSTCFYFNLIIKEMKLHIDVIYGMFFC